MRKVMLVGTHHCGKSTLIRVLSGEAYEPRKALAVTYFGRFVDTPSEFLENRFFYGALITSSGECAALLFVQDASSRTCRIPPGFAAMFNRRVVGVITKCDRPDADPVLAERFLRMAGTRTVVRVSARTGLGMDRLREEMDREAP